MILLLAACGVPADPPLGAPEAPTDAGAASVTLGSPRPLTPTGAAKACGTTAPSITWASPSNGALWLVEGGITVDENGVGHTLLQEGPRLWDLYPDITDADGDLANASLHVWMDTDGDGSVDTSGPPLLIVSLADSESKAPECGTPAVDAAFACAVDGTGGIDGWSCRVGASMVHDIAVQAIDDAGNVSDILVMTGTSPAVR